MQMFYNFESETKLGQLISWKGNIGVDIFFVLSGFVMYLCATRPHITGWEFFVKRLFRVLPAYWFYTILLMVFSIYFVSEFNFTAFTINSLSQSLFFIPHENPSGIGFFPYLTVGWTLNYEVMFYSTLSLCLALSKKFALMLTSIVTVVLLVLLRDVDITIVAVLKVPK